LNAPAKRGRAGIALASREDLMRAPDSANCVCFDDAQTGAIDEIRIDLLRAQCPYSAKSAADG